MTEIVSREHLKDIYEIEKLSFSEPWSEKSLEMLLNGDNFGVAITLEGRVVAYGGLMCVLDEGSVTNVAVHPEYRRRGYGREIVFALLSEAEKRGISTLFLEVRESNLAARTLYEKMGFSSCGIRKGFYSHPAENAIQMIYKIKG